MTIQEALDDLRRDADVLIKHFFEKATKAMVDYSAYFSTRQTSQQVQVKKEQIQNSAGGFVFQLSVWDRLDRWLILGAEGGTYYVGEKDLTVQNAQTIQECLALDGVRTVTRIVEISTSGRAPKNAPAIFALAMAAGHTELRTREVALMNLSKVCRTGTDLFAFVAAVKNFRGWGRMLRKAVAKWYYEKSAKDLTYQVLKYQQRNGWSHRDVLRLAGGAILLNGDKTPQWGAHYDELEHQAIYRWIVTGGLNLDKRIIHRKQEKNAKMYDAISEKYMPDQIVAYERMKKAETWNQAVQLINSYKLTHEMVPNQFKSSPDVWNALLEDMPLKAMLRNLGKMSSVGLLLPFSAALNKVVYSLLHKEKIKKARIHPLDVLLALNVYSQGHGIKGSLKWDVLSKLKDALNEMFYLAFETIEPTNKNIVVALDVSGSMTSGTIAGMTGITPRVGAAAMGMATVRVEPNYLTLAFSNGIQPFVMSKSESLDTICARMDNMPFERTDCAAPMVWAYQNRIEVDAFYVYTDNETWSGQIHPFQALQMYRQRMGKNSKLIVVGMTSSGFSIADPTDSGMLDVVGFDTAAPAMMSNFIKKGFDNTSVSS